MRAFLSYYWYCVRHAPSASWWLIGVISTLATFVPAVISKLIVWESTNVKAANESLTDTMNLLLIGSLPVAAFLCFIFVPFWEAFRLYREKDEELKRKDKELEMERKKSADVIAELESRQNSNPGTNALRRQVSAYISEFESIQQRISNGDKGAAVGAYKLEHSVIGYLKTHLPQYTDFATLFPMSLSMPHQPHVNMDDAIARCQKRVEQLNELLTEIIG